MSSIISTLLTNIGLSRLIGNFKDEKLDDIQIIGSLTDSEMTRVGVSSIGDRIRLRDACRRNINDGNSTTAVITSPTSSDAVARSNNSNISSSSSSSLLPSNHARSRVQEQRSFLFQGRAARGGRRASSTTGRSSTVSRTTIGRTWTMNIYCLANKHSVRVPTALEKISLQKAGLGFQKVKVFLGDNEETVLNKLKDAFPGLKECGGIELMSCLPHSRDLLVLNSCLAAQQIKEAIGGGQGRIYLRPIQKNLSLVPLEEEKSSKLKEKCLTCGEDVLVKDLRIHMECCDGGFSESSSDDDIFNYPVFPLQNSEADNMEHTSQPETTAYSSPAISTSPPITSNSPPITSISPHLSSSALPSTITSTPLQTASSSSFDIEKEIIEIISDCRKQEFENNPVEILRIMQKQLVQGRDLEISDATVCINGLTNFIMVDRFNLLKTGLEEIGLLENKFICLEVQFYNEVGLLEICHICIYIYGNQY